MHSDGCIIGWGWLSLNAELPSHNSRRRHHILFGALPPRYLAQLITTHLSPPFPRQASPGMRGMRSSDDLELHQ